jgi:hypothetical protein
MSEQTLTIRVPLAVRKRGGRKVVLAPDQAASAPAREPPNWTLVKNLARAFRWQRMLENGCYLTIAELAKAERVTDSYISRIVSRALMTPHEVERICVLIMRQ